MTIFENQRSNMERSGSVGRVLDWGSLGCYFETRLRRGHCVVSLNKTHYPLISDGSTQEDENRP